MKDINYANCMKRKCQDCKHFNYCFGYKPKKGKKNGKYFNR